MHIVLSVFLTVGLQTGGDEAESVSIDFDDAVDLGNEPEGG